MKVVGQLGNPFVATSLELVALVTLNVMEESVVASLSEIREVGQTLHAALRPRKAGRFICSYI